VRRERFVVATLFAVAIAIAFPKTVFFDTSLIPSDNLNPFDYRLIPQNYGPSVLPPAEFRERGLLLYPHFHDIGAALWQSEPGLIYLRDALRDGEMPLWDPFTGSGAPALANLTCAHLFPPQIVVALAGATSAAKNIYLLLIFWTAGFATYVVLRRHNISAAASFTGGLAFMFSGALQEVGPVLMEGQAVAMIPVVLALTHWFVERPTWRRTACLSIAYAFVAQASFPPVLLMAFGTATVYVLLTVYTRTTDTPKVAGVRFAAAAGLSLGMSAFLYLPAAITLAHSPQAQQFYSAAAQKTVRIRALFQLLSPTATGGTLIYARPVMDDFDQLLYAGTFAVMLATIGAFRGRRRSPVLWLTTALVGWLTLMKLLGAPPVQWIAFVPGFRTVHFAFYFGILLDFVIAIFVAMGIDALIRRDADDHALAAAIAVIVFSFVGLWGISRESKIWLDPDQWRWLADWQMITMFALIGAILIVAAQKLRSAAVARILVYGLMAAVFVEGVINTVYPRQHRFDVFAHLPPYVARMRELPDSGRYFTAKVLDANLGSSAQVRQVDSLYNFHESRVFDLYTAYSRPDTGISFQFLRDATVLPPDPVLDRMNVAYIAVRAGEKVTHAIEAEADARKYAVRFSDEYARIYERPSMPRAFFTSDYRVASRDEALKLAGTEPRDRLILEERPPFASVPNAPSDPAAQFVRNGRNHLAIRIHAGRAGLLYLADSFFAGWTARVNGRPAPILVANYAYRAVPVSAGDSLVEFDYFPAGMPAGLIISAIALAATLILLTRPTMHRA
jgi:hypothetical protein